MHMSDECIGKTIACLIDSSGMARACAMGGACMVGLRAGIVQEEKRRDQQKERLVVRIGEHLVVQRIRENISNSVD